MPILARIGLIKMAVKTVLAKDVKIEIGNVEIKGLNTISFSDESTEADLTVKEDAGSYNHEISQRARSITLEGKYLVDITSKARDPGQLAVDELALGIGANSIGTFTITDPGGNKITFKASATSSNFGGDNTEGTAWSATLKVAGAFDTFKVI